MYRVSEFESAVGLSYLLQGKDRGVFARVRGNAAYSWLCFWSGTNRGRPEFIFAHDCSTGARRCPSLTCGGCQVRDAQNDGPPFEAFSRLHKGSLHLNDSVQRGVQQESGMFAAHSRLRQVQPCRGQLTHTHKIKYSVSLPNLHLSSAPIFPVSPCTASMSSANSNPPRCG